MEYKFTKILMYLGSIFFLFEAFIHFFGLNILEHDKIFPQRANIGVAQIISKNEIKLRVWERGAGETLACGSGACAAVAAGLRRNLLSNKVMVQLPGGILNIEITENGDILMTGPVAVVFTGFMEI